MIAPKKIIAGFVALLVVICAFGYAAPYITVYRMKKAVMAHDAAAISDHVNFPAFRESLKGNFSAAVAKESAKEKKNPFAALGASLASAFINPVVDSLVTPEAVVFLMHGETPSLGKKKGEGKARKNEDLQYAMGYETVNRFVVKTANNEKKEVVFVFTRDGLSWKLSGIRLPL